MAFGRKEKNIFHVETIEVICPENVLFPFIPPKWSNKSAWFSHCHTIINKIHMVSK